MGHVLQVERAKKCLDFSATLYLTHLAIVSVIGGFPTSRHLVRGAARQPHFKHSVGLHRHVMVGGCGCRWLVNVGAMAITAVLGEWLCLRRELQDIPISEQPVIAWKDWAIPLHARVWAACALSVARIGKRIACRQQGVPDEVVARARAGSITEEVFGDGGGVCQDAEQPVGGALSGAAPARRARAPCSCPTAAARCGPSRRTKCRNGRHVCACPGTYWMGSQHPRCLKQVTKLCTACMCSIGHLPGCGTVCSCGTPDNTWQACFDQAAVTAFAARLERL